jgi:DNA-binding protein YbaB
MDEQLQAQMAELAGGFQERLAEIQQRQQAANQVAVTARSRDGMVSVEVGAYGQLLDLVLDPGVYERMSPQRLVAAIKELARTATVDATARSQEIMAPVVPPGGLPEDGDFTKVLAQWKSWPGRWTDPAGH